MSYIISKKAKRVAIILLSVELLILGLLLTECTIDSNSHLSDKQEQITESKIFDINRVEQIRNELLNSQSKKILVVAHRADWRNAPENSIQAIKNAIEMGVDMVEIDVRKTKDNQLVIIHDKTLNRTTNGTGKVSDWTLESLRNLYLRNGQGRVTRFKIPTLEEALLAAKGKVLVNLDKSYNYFDEVFKLTEATGTTNQVVMKAKKPYGVVKEEFGQYLDKVLFMPIIDLSSADANQWIEDYLRQDPPVAFELVFFDDKYLTNKITDKITQGGSKIWINGLWGSLNGGHDDNRALTDMPGSYGWIINQGATLIQTDRPQLVIDYLQSIRLN
jgi:glycerophosphoryl diester phosphodiesterase